MMKITTVSHGIMNVDVTGWPVTRDTRPDATLGYNIECVLAVLGGSGVCRAAAE